MGPDLMHVLTVATLASSAAMLLVLMLREPMRRRFGVRAAYGLWALVPLSAAVALLPAPAESISMQILPPAATELIFAAAPLAASAAASDTDLSTWLIATWLLGFAAAFLILAWQQRRFVRGLGRLTVSGDQTLRAEATAGCPALLGAWRPRVVLPADFEQRYSMVERELILAHERTHRARGDAQINAFAAALRCAFWFNPLVHFAASRFRFDQELACDAIVISRFPHARRPYADAMLKAQLAGFGLPVGCNWQSSHPLKQRIALMKRPLPGRARAMLGMAVAAALVVGGTYSAWAMQAGPTSSGHESRGMIDLQNRSLDRSDKPATYRRLSRITYPQGLIEAKVEGVVYVKARVDAAGNVLTAVVDRVDPPEATALGESAVEGVRNWAFEPARKQGKPIESDEIVPVVFALDRQASPKISGATLGPVRVALPKPMTSVSPPSRDAGAAGNVASAARPVRTRPAAAAEASIVARESAPADEDRNAATPAPLAVGADRAAGNHSDPIKRIQGISTAGVGATGVFTPPRVIHRWRPPYPAQAYQAHEEGESQVLVTIGADGGLKEAHVNRSSGSESLDQASLDAVKRYAFDAAQKGGVPIEAQANVAFEWTISPPLEFTSVSGMTVRR
ncbi:MAG TPA: TonB family protein [Rudaea sp.]|nr:TonB family protein [Rudaea sp.]